MTTEPHRHWHKVYTDKQPGEVSWHQATPAPSLATLDRFAVPPTQPLIDIGGGASTLVDALLERGWRDLTVLDIATPALAAARGRLGSAASDVQ